MRPGSATLERLAGALTSVLAGRRVERIWRPDRCTLLWKIQGLTPRRLLIEVAPGHPRVIVTERWPETPSAPDRETLILRHELEGGRFVDVEAVDARHLALRIGRGDGERRLTVQLAGRYLNVGLFDGDGEERMRLLHGAPAIDPDAPPLRGGVGDDEASEPDHDDATFLARLDEASWADADRRALEAAKRTVLRDARKHAKKLGRALSAAETDLERADEAEGFRHSGELLKTALHRAKRGDTEVVVDDWARGGAPCTVALDPTLTPIENMERYFHRYRKFARAKDAIEERALAAMEGVEAARALVAEIDALDTEPESREATEAALAAAVTRLEGLGWRGPRAGPGEARGAGAGEGAARPYRRFEAADGTAILVGKGARHNDELTFKLARGADVWLHARDYAGSHVVVPVRGDGPSQEALLDAATLAAWHSKARGETVVDVMWTERKHVRRARGGNPGQVTVSASKNLAVRVDQARIERLYGTLDADR